MVPISSVRAPMLTFLTNRMICHTNIAQVLCKCCTFPFKCVQRTENCVLAKTKAFLLLTHPLLASSSRPIYINSKVASIYFSALKE